MIGSPPTSDPLVAPVTDIVAGRPPKPVDARMVAALGHRLERLGVAGLALAEHRAREDAGGAGGLPDALVERLLPAYHRTALHTTLVLESACRTRGVLADAGVPSLLFKGAALCLHGVYRDPGARPLEDTDILVRPEHAERAVRALLDAGYEAWTLWTPGRTSWCSAFSFTDPAGPDGAPPSVDLHWATPYARLRAASPWPVDPLWRGAEDGVPSPEAHFAVLAEHVLKHLRVVVHVRGIADLVRVLPTVRDGAELRRQAELRGSLPGLRLALDFLADVMEVRVPSSVRGALGDPRAPRRRARTRLGPERVFAEAPADPSRAAGVWRDWWLLGTPWDSLVEVGRVLLPSGRWLSHRYDGGGTTLGRRARYLGELTRWVLGRGRSPLSPNQGLEA